MWGRGDLALGGADGLQGVDGGADGVSDPGIEALAEVFGRHADAQPADIPIQLAGVVGHRLLSGG